MDDNYVGSVTIDTCLLDPHGKDPIMVELESLQEAGFIELLTTQEVANELPKGLGPLRHKDAEFIFIYGMGDPQSRYHPILDCLRPNKTNRTSQDQMDARHLMIHSYGGGEFFLTRDKIILKNKEGLRAFSMHVMAPEEYLSLIKGRISNRNKVLKILPR